MTNSIIITGELYSSKNSRRIAGRKRTFLLKSVNAKKQEYDFAFQLGSYGNRTLWKNMIAAKPFPLKVSFKIFRRTNGIFDYTNITQGLLDAMAKAGYLPDDSARFIIPVFEQYEVDKDNPRTIISIVQ